MRGAIRLAGHDPASDYLPTGLLAAAVLLAARMGLPAAVALVTSGGAEVAGLADRGRLVAGQRVDLVLAAVRAEWPVVVAAVRAGALGSSLSRR